MAQAEVLRMCRAIQSQQQDACRMAGHDARIAYEAVIESRGKMETAALHLESALRHVRQWLGLDAALDVVDSTDLAGDIAELDDREPCPATEREVAQ